MTDNTEKRAAILRESLVQAVKNILRGSPGTEYTDAGMEDAFFRWPAIADAILAAQPAPLGETWASIAGWCEQTFGPCIPARVAKRASEEMRELIDETAEAADWTDKAREEAADVAICLSRVPGIWEAVERKMAINRAREWRLMGDGTGYHVRPGNEPPAPLPIDPVACADGELARALRHLADAADEINGLIDGQVHEARTRDPDDPEADVILPWEKIDAMNVAIFRAQALLRGQENAQ